MTQAFCSCVTCARGPLPIHICPPVSTYLPTRNREGEALYVVEDAAYELQPDREAYIFVL